METSQKQQTGFTIVELLIVIVVIAILATITIVAYNGIQIRSMASRSIQDLASINKGLMLYYAANGNYPLSVSWRSSNDYPTDYVPSISPSFISKLPTPLYSGGTALTEAYMYLSDGSDYKIIAHAGRYGNLCLIAKATNPQLVPNRDCWAYGYYSPGGSLF